MAATKSWSTSRPSLQIGMKGLIELAQLLLYAPTFLAVVQTGQKVF
jgi:hypothetical protein